MGRARFREKERFREREREREAMRKADGRLNAQFEPGVTAVRQHGITPP